MAAHRRVVFPRAVGEVHYPDGLEPLDADQQREQRAFQRHARLTEQRLITLGQVRKRDQVHERLLELPKGELPTLRTQYSVPWPPEP
jgi:hypothetical protein